MAAKLKSTEEVSKNVVPVHDVKCAPKTYASGIAWAAANAGVHTSSIDFLKNSEAVCLLAILAGVGTVRVAEDVLRYRRYG